MRLLRRLKKRGIPLVHTAHDLMPHGSDLAEDRDFFGKLYRFVDHVVVHAERNRDELVASFGVEPRNVSVIPHGAVTNFVPEALTKEAARRELGLDPKGRGILFFGLVKRYKGLEYLVEAFRDIRARIPGATLLIVGRIATEDPESGPFYTNIFREL